ncbi:nuclear transport factor 2 family protein [Actinocorallia sp. A-T 12471]|uniref:nuclear transport factor 2 family protein n=1 Tax=Actinocorallia sp. A-T 12471 TaxID=3089813 RepID=UPI0029D1CBA6|nr:nuclear transport factor 2 family protein [Actinocorallia sp. A-T 12471]MDX6741378.1 nuclear transport factor 2 family protein [Actinocorallia sp. A-T 12471]
MDDTLARLAAVEDIKRLKYRYLRTLDLKRWDEFAETLAPDATADYGSHAGGTPLRFAGRDAIVGYLSGALGPDITTVHVCHHPEITVDGDTAQATWCLEDTVLATPFRTLIRGAAYYTDTYRRDAAAWRISHTSYTRLYEATIPYTDLPNLHLTTPEGS